MAIGRQWWQIDRCRWRYSLAGQTVTIHQHLDGSVSIRWGPHVVAQFAPGGGNAGAAESAENPTAPWKTAPPFPAFPRHDSLFPNQTEEGSLKRKRTDRVLRKAADSRATDTHNTRILAL